MIAGVTSRGTWRRVAASFVLMFPQVWSTSCVFCLFVFVFALDCLLHINCEKATRGKKLYVIAFGQAAGIVFFGISTYKTMALASCGGSFSYEPAKKEECFLLSADLKLQS